VAKNHEGAVSTRNATAGFTNNLKCLKKSTPIKGNFTSLHLPREKSMQKETAMKRQLQSLFSPAAIMLTAGTCEVRRTTGRVC
jgi:hypothetical protein